MDKTKIQDFYKGFFKVQYGTGERDREPGILLCLLFALMVMLLPIKNTDNIFFFPWWTAQAAGAALAVIFLVWILMTGQTARLKTAMQMMLLFMLPVLVKIFYSLFVAVMNFATWDQVWFGARVFIEILIGIVGASVALAAMGKKALPYGVLGLIFSGVLIISAKINNDGFAEMLYYIVDVFEGNPILSERMINHNVLFAIGYGIVFLCFDFKLKVSRVVPLGILAFIFIIGFKRTALVGVGVAILFLIITRFMKPAVSKRFVQLTGLVLILAALFNVWFVWSGGFEKFVDNNEIDSAGRKELFHYVDGDYDMSPFFLGKGTGYVGNKVTNLQESGQSIAWKENSIHNDVLTEYVELGMLGFILFSFCQYFFTTKYLTDRFSPRAARLWMAMMICYFIARCINPIEGITGYTIMIIFAGGTVFQDMDEQKALAPPAEQTAVSKKKRKKKKVNQ